MASSIYKYTEKRKQQIEYLLQAPPNLIDRAWLHDIRVEIKRCKATYEMLDAANISFSAAFPALQRLFKKAGKVRELQVVQRKLKDLPAAVDAQCLFSLLGYREDLLLTHFLHHKATRMQPVLSELEALLQHLLPVTVSQQNSKVQHALQSIYLVLQLPYHPDLHLLRRQVKWIMYQCEACNWAGHSASRIKFLKGINRLQNLLGNWHDWQVALQEITGLASNKHRTTCMLLSQQILLRQNDLQNEIRFQIRDCLNAFEKTHVARTRQAVAKAAL